MHFLCLVRDFFETQATKLGALMASIEAHAALATPNASQLCLISQFVTDSFSELFGVIICTNEWIDSSATILVLKL